MAGAGGAIRAGRAFVELFLHDKMTAGLRKASAKLKAFGSSVSAMGARMAGFGVGAGVALALAGKAFADFENNMQMVATMLDKPEENLEAFSAGVRKLSKEFGESTATMSKGLYDILSAGVAPAEALDVLEASARGAVGGMTDVATSADAVTTMLNSYGLEASHAGDVTDLLFGIVKKGKTTFAEVAANIGKVASIANTAGVSMEELGAMMATLTAAGLNTEEATTAVRQSIAAFLKPSKEANAAFKEMTGMEMNPQTLKQLGGLRGVFELIKTMNPDQVAKIFPNIRAMAGVMPVLNNLEGFDSSMETMVNRSGLAGDAFDKMSQTMSFAFGSAKQAVIDLFVVLGQGLVPVFNWLAETINKAVTYLQPWIQKNQHIIALVGKLAIGAIAGGAALIVLGKAFAFIGAVVGVVGTGIAVVKGLLLALLSPIGLVVAAVGGIGYAFLNFTDAGQRVLGEAKQVFKSLYGIAETTIGGIGDALKAGDWKLAAKIAWAGMKSSWKTGTHALSEAWIGFKHGFMNVWTDLATGAQKAWTKFSGWLKKGWNNLKAVFGGADKDAMAAANREIDKRTAHLNKLADMKANQEKSGRAALHDKEMKQLAAEERNARKELDDMRKEAADKRKAFEESLDAEGQGIDGEGGGALGGAGFDPSTLDGIDTDGLKAGGSAAAEGFINSFAALRMGGNQGIDVAKQQVDEAKKTNEQLSDIAILIRENPMTLGIV